MSGRTHRSHARIERLSSVVVVALVVTLATFTTGVVPRQPAQAQVASSPNVVIILVDDMRWDEGGVPTALKEAFPAGYLPTITGTLAQNGFTAKNAFVVNSLCCPSRASILTGNYSHTTGVWNNEGQNGTGGWNGFKHDEGSTLATWFHAAGYRTALVGKYLNGFNNTTYVPPGWDRWVAFKNSTIGYYNYTLLIDGQRTQSYGSTAQDYSTDVLGDYAASYVRSAATATPFFLYYTPYAPHAPYTPAPRDKGALSSYKPSMPPNVAEADVSDKPRWVQALRAGAGAGWGNNKRRQMEMLMAVDDSIAKIVAALRDTGRLNNTIMLFTSDNGMSGGSHRWTTKKSGWDEALRVPFIIRGPSIAPGTSSGQIALNIDIADTLGSLTGVAIPSTDGASLAPLFASPTQAIHSVFAFERLGDSTNPPSYCGVRTPQYKYIRYANGEEELYDLSADPWEMRSLDADPSMATLKSQLLTQTKQICDPPPPGYSFG